MLKEYGKLTADQFRGFIEQLPEFRRQEARLRDQVASVTKERLKELFKSGCNWSWVYELPFNEHIALVLFAFNRVGWVKNIAAAPDPHQALLDDADEDNFGIDEQGNDDFHPLFQKHDVIGLAVSMQRTVLSIMLYQRTLSGLVQEFREEGNLDAMFNAIRVDRAAIACPSIADRIALAEFAHDSQFFIRLRSALKGVQKKHWEAYNDLRYSLYVLRELGFDKLSDDQLENLLVHTLKVYPNVPGARKNLRRQYQLSKKIKTI